MNEILERIIIGESRHYFIYGENGEKRRELLQSIADKHPIILDSNTPVGVYVDDFSLPEPTNIVTYADKSKLPTFGREYLSFCIAYKLLTQLQYQTGIYIADIRIKKFLEDINRIFKNQDYNDIQDLRELIDALNDSKQFYKQEYKNLLEIGRIVEDINDLPIPFLNLNSFIRMLKKMINTNSYFALIFDNQTASQLISQQAINGIVTRRINSDISMNIICDPNEWKTYYDLNGMLAEDIHDYGSRNLQDLVPSFQKVKKL